MEYLLVFGAVLIVATAMRLWFGSRRAKYYAERIKRYGLSEQPFEKTAREKAAVNHKNVK
ncbi:hypothetical protein HP456_12080 [Bacillus haikouensis]|jgi:hypothetical protein|uniref:hypothetical protein n=1 Tax=Bacillus haikouensis TaxID=1510468 RepID=UPI0015545AE7|nr:hypothetical protein [Bacillus haikouensis]NQD66658.1 hypothetical protein [Bacillus haikouensis]